jgi:periplasmic divalent cation tolerance protein
VSSRALIVLTACAGAEQANRLATALVEQKLAACVNAVGSVTSTYRWQGAVQQEQECLLVIKTTEARFAALEQAIREQSTYELPEVIAIPVQTGSARYLEWLRGSVNDGSGVPNA